MSIRWLLLFIPLLTCFQAAAQDYFHYIRFAEEAKAEGDDYGAMVYYETAYALDSTDQDLQYNYARSLEATHYYAKALRLYTKIYNKGRGRFYPDGAARIAQLKMYLGEYETAIKFWQRAIRFVEDDPIETARISQRLRSCSFALSHSLAADSIVVRNAGADINTTESEYGADLLQDELISFSSLRGPYNADLELKRPTAYSSQVYTSELDAYGFGPAEIKSLDPDSSYLHIGNACPDPTGEFIYFTEVTAEGSRLIKRSQAHAPIEYAETLARGINAPGTQNTQPFVYLDTDGEVYILFSSDRAGGQGGFDIWKGRLSGSSDYGIQNLGPEINSPGDEVCPFFSGEEQRLYFSSDWHEGYGGYDIFHADVKAGIGFTAPVNLELPINSPVNDLYYRHRSDLRMLTSNRSGSMSDHAAHCCNDIYFIEAVAEPTEPEVVYDQLPDRISDVDELKGLLPITLYFHNDIPDPGSQSHSSDANYATTVADYLAMEGQYVTRYAEGLAGALRDTAAMNMQQFFKEEVQAEFDELEGVARLLFTQLEKGKVIEIAIKGYASPLAQSDYNKRLTQRRIESVRNYLYAMDEGILRPYMRGEDPGLKIVAIPFGEEESESFVSDNPQDAKNSIYSIAAARERRVEILRINEVD